MKNQIIEHVNNFIPQVKVENVNAITTMKRYEMKYILTKEQYVYLKEALSTHMKVDKYGLTSIASIYYDTPNYRLIITSIDKPEYKEKVRLRSYGLAKPGDKVFLEIKRKAFSEVYKRRIVTTERDVKNFFNYKEDIAHLGQIEKEITYLRNYYKTLVPKIMIIYDRVAYYEVNGSLRITFDQNPRYRTYDLNLMTSLEGESLLNEGEVILEIKVQEAMPLWLTNILNKGKIYQSSFSKVGEAYKRMINKERMA